MIPAASPLWPDVRAETTNSSAAMPSRTKVLTPSRRQPSPFRAAARATFRGAWCAPSSTARVATSSPAAILGSQARFCASEPPRTRALAPARAVASSGEAVSVRPVSSRIRPRPR